MPVDQGGMLKNIVIGAALIGLGYSVYYMLKWKG
jgi:hypothetical protein